MDIGPGDWVECVGSNDGPTNTVGLKIAKGAVYVVASVGVVPPGYTYSGEPYVALVNPKPLPGTFGFHASQFRPIYRPKAEFFRDLLAPVDLVSA